MAPKKGSRAAIPMDTDAEESVIGTIMVNAEALKRASSILSIEDFWHDETARIYSACVALLDIEGKAEKTPVINILKSQEIFEDVGGEEYIDRLLSSSDAVCFASNVSKIKNLSVLRSIMHMSNKALKDISENNADATTMLETMEAEIGSLAAKSKGLPPRIVGIKLSTTNPRSYKLKFSNGEEVGLSIENLMKAAKVKESIINALDFVPALPKDWERFIRQLMDRAERETTEGADLTLDVLDVIRDMFDAKGEGGEASDMRTGAFAIETIDGKEYYLFQKMAAVNHIRQYLDRGMDTVQLWRLVKGWGGIDSKDGKPISKRIGDSSRTALWGIPSKVVKPERHEEVDVDWMMD